MRRARELLKNNSEKHEEANKIDRERKKIQRKNLRYDREGEKESKKAVEGLFKDRDKNKMCNNILNDLKENTPPSSPVQFDHQAQNDEESTVILQTLA